LIVVNYLAAVVLLVIALGSAGFGWRSSSTIFRLFQLLSNDSISTGLLHHGCPVHD